MVTAGDGQGDAVAGSVWDEVLDTEHVVVVRTYVEHWPRKDRAPEKVLIVVAGPDEQARDRCPQCGQRGKPVEYDTVRWRTLDVHGKRCFLESRLPRINCGRHGKITAAVPWARHDDRFSRPFEEFAAWQAAHLPWSRAAAGLRVTWDALANVVARVAADAAAGRDRLAGLRRIGIDEKSWGKGAPESTWSSSPITTPGGSCGLPRAVTRRPCAPSSATWEQTGRSC
jgi:transposase